MEKITKKKCLTASSSCGIIKTIQEREVKEMVERIVVTVMVVVFFTTCVMGCMVLDKCMTQPLMDKYTTHNTYTYAVDVTVVEHTSNGCTLLEDADGWLWMMHGQEVEVGAVGVLVLDNMDTPDYVYDDEIVDFR